MKEFAAFSRAVRHCTSSVRWITGSVPGPRDGLAGEGHPLPGRARLVRQGQVLEYLTLGCCVLETSIGLFSGFVHNSVALLAFGAESLIEVVSASILIWRLNNDHLQSHAAERRTLRIEGICFIALAFCVSADSMHALWKRERPTATVLGFALALFSLLGMPLLAAAKRKVGCSLASDALKADATQSALCGYFALILLAGLLANEHFGLWWADSTASLIMVPLIAMEGKKALEGRNCSHCC